MVSDGCEHPLDLMIFPFSEGDDCHTGGDSGTFRRQTADLAASFPEGDAAHKFLRDIFCERIAELCEIIFQDMVFRGEHPVRELTIIGHEEKAGGVEIESAAGCKLREPVLGAEQIKDGFLVFILGSGNDAGGFMEQKVVVYGIRNGCSAEGNLIFFGEYGAVGFSDDDAVNLYSARTDSRLCFFSGEGSLFG